MKKLFYIDLVAAVPKDVSGIIFEYTYGTPDLIDWPSIDTLEGTRTMHAAFLKDLQENLETPWGIKARIWRNEVLADNWCKWRIFCRGSNCTLL